MQIELYGKLQRVMGVSVRSLILLSLTQNNDACPTVIFFKKGDVLKIFFDSI